MTILEPPPPEDGDDDDEGYPPRRPRHLVLRGVALALVIAMVLAFPLAYIADVVTKSQRPGVVLFMLEVVVLAVVWAAVRVSRRL